MLDSVHLEELGIPTVTFVTAPFEGAARTLARIRLLGDPGNGIVRLMLRDALPLHVGDRVLLRDPGSAGPAILGATVLDVAPPPLTRRGAATASRLFLASK